MADTNIKSTFWKIKLQTGEEVDLTLNFAALYRLRAKDRTLYDRYNRISTSGKLMEDLDNIIIIYTAYVCAHINEDYMSFQDFLEVAPYDREKIGDAIMMLLTPNAKKRIHRGIQESHKKVKQ